MDEKQNNQIAVKKNSKQLIIIISVIVILIAAFAICWEIFSDKPVQGDKTITVAVVINGVETTHTLNTDATNLRAALEEKQLISGDESEYGLFVTTVDGVTADSSKEEWWCFTKNGETLLTGVDDTVIADGEKYEITLTVGYSFG